MKQIPFGYNPSKYKTKSPFRFLMPFKRYRQQGFLYYFYQKLVKLESKYKKLDSIHNSFIKKYLKFRILFGKVDIPYIEVVLTLKCTMRCESCAVMVPYFNAKNQYTCSTEHIIESLNAMLDKVDSIRLVRLIGGETLLYKDIVNVVKFLDSNPKIKAFNIVTNGTIIPSNELLESLKDTHKAMIFISDYTRSPNLKVPLKHEAIINLLKSYKIRYYFSLQNDELWVDGGEKYKRNRSKEEIRQNFKNCMLRCVSLMSVDSGDKSVDTQSLAPKGAVFVCPIASSLSRLKGLDEFSGDFIDLANASKERYLEFYAQDFYKACDYCPDMKNGWWNGKQIPVAVQTNETFKIP
ncbi:radical SAM protein [Helicobacter saguini]|nr:radical SAM protein [Helicobacter saguini]MWV69511.1 radical SAM protein [Helicobacter saguini]MWV70938.1 radical SAM protein [Helicobacter saguini]